MFINHRAWPRKRFQTPKNQRMNLSPVGTQVVQLPDVPGSINSHYFHIIGDGKLNPIVGVYIPIIRIPIKGGMTIPNIATFDHGTNVET